MNNYKAWKKAELKLLGSNLGNPEIAAKLGRTPASVRAKRCELGLRNPGRPTVENKSSVTQDLKAHDDHYWMREHSALSQKYTSCSRLPRSLSALCGALNRWHP